ncbi:hypothetical protein D3C74_443850 [compost metagenome]
MDGAGAYHHQQAIVRPAQDLAHLVAVLVNMLRHIGQAGVLCQQVGRGGERLHREGAHYRIQNSHLGLPCCGNGVDDGPVTLGCLVQGICAQPHHLC